MKYLKFILFFSLPLLWGSNAFSQNINWNSLASGQKNIVNLHAGIDYSLSAGLGFGYHLPTRMPVVLNLEYSMPAGSTIFDDLKTKIGAQARVLQFGNILTTARVFGNFRKYENSLVNIASFGCETSMALGYYKPKWFAAAECGFDKAIATHLHHNAAARKDFPEIQDGWYVPTAGNFSYGVQAGFSIKRQDLYLKLGKVLTQNFKSTPSIPYYVQLGVNHRF